MSLHDPCDQLVHFRTFRPEDCVEISRTLSAELLKLGLTEDPGTIDEGRALAAAGPAWTAVHRDGTILCCAGFATDQFEQALAWAMLTTTVGPAHLAITRFARWQVETSPIWRIDAFVPARREEMKWARLCGFTVQADLGRWGPHRERTFIFTRLLDEVGA